MPEGWSVARDAWNERTNAGKTAFVFLGEESRSFWFSLPGISHILSDSPFHVAYVALGVAYDPHVFFHLDEKVARTLQKKQSV